MLCIGGALFPKEKNTKGKLNSDPIVQKIIDFLERGEW